MGNLAHLVVKAFHGDKHLSQRLRAYHVGLPLERQPAREPHLRKWRQDIKYGPGPPNAQDSTSSPCGMTMPQPCTAPSRWLRAAHLVRRYVVRLLRRQHREQVDHGQRVVHVAERIHKRRVPAGEDNPLCCLIDCQLHGHQLRTEQQYDGMMSRLSLTRRSSV